MNIAMMCLGFLYPSLSAYAASSEYRSALVGYLEWGSRLAVLNSAASADPIDPQAPMPWWGWGEVKGPYAQ
jgi:hypothetical protein